MMSPIVYGAGALWEPCEYDIWSCVLLLTLVRIWYKVVLVLVAFALEQNHQDVPLVLA